MAQLFSTPDVSNFVEGLEFSKYFENEKSAARTEITSRRLMGAFMSTAERARSREARHLVLDIDISEGDAIYVNEGSICKIAARRGLPFNIFDGIEYKDGQYTVRFKHDL